MRSGRVSHSADRAEYVLHLQFLCNNKWLFFILFSFTMEKYDQIMFGLEYFSTIYTVNCSTVFQFPSVIIYSEGIVETKTDQTFAGALLAVKELLSHCDREACQRGFVSHVY